ncbi:MAG: hypothetical protein KF868_11085 [Acidobacteria bacterium]|nr:hypothetical protein [Acidobacteriota bacterium]MCW5969842.1 hypothetical protein [Blastocatellales bacterium]
MNDINAAYAGASQKQSGSLEERLARLAGLHRIGMMDDDEFAERRRKILDEI